MNKGSGGGKATAPPFAYTEQFEKLFPYYLSIGMTYEQYWEQDCDLVKFYRKASIIKQEVRNQELWLQGLYIYEAICDVSPALRAFGAKKPRPYPKEPYDLNIRRDRRSKEEKEQSNDNKAKAIMEAFMAMNNKKFETGGGETHG